MKDVITRLQYNVIAHIQRVLRAIQYHVNCEIKREMIRHSINIILHSVYKKQAW